MAETLRKANAQSAEFIGKVFAEMTDNPLQRKLTFVFTDFAPNGNKQGVPKSEAENVARTSLFQPVKINFNGDSPEGHNGADPIGPIVKMTQTDTEIVGEAILWRDEFPDVDEYLMKASAEQGGVQFSWELYFEESETDDQGVQWLHGITSAGICIVKTPAYQGRTPLIAIAEETMTTEELQAQVSDLANKLYSMLDALWSALSIPGARDNAVGIEDQFTTILDAVKSMSSMVDELKSTASLTEAELAELEGLRAFKNELEQAAAKAELLSARRATLETAGIKLTDEHFAQREQLILGLSDDLFAQYVQDLVSMLPTKESEKASLQPKPITIPDPMTNSVTTPSMRDLASALRNLKNL